MTADERLVFLNQFRKNIDLFELNFVILHDSKDESVLSKASKSDHLDFAYTRIMLFNQVFLLGKEKNTLDFTEDSFIVPKKNPFYPLIIWYVRKFALRSSNNLCI